MIRGSQCPRESSRAFKLAAAVFLVLLARGLVLPQSAGAAGTGAWRVTGVLANGRYGHTATLLRNGKVLVVGGLEGDIGVIKSAEIYDPASGTWSGTGSLNYGRRNHTATLLPNGKVLVTGGANIDALTSSEIYDPTGGTWSVTGPLTTGRYSHTATLLNSGKVLVTGGSNIGALTSSELYDPTGGTWSGTGPLSNGRGEHTATLLPNGKVLVAGGYDPGTRIFLNSAELYNPIGPTEGTWSVTGSLTTGRGEHTATLLRNGKVLVAAGLTLVSGNATYLASAELYDPAKATWSGTGSLIFKREFHKATLLASGRVLVVGGLNSDGFLSSAEIYNWPVISGVLQLLLLD